MTAFALTPPGPANCPEGSIPGFHPTMVPSSVAKRNTALATVCPALPGPAIWKLVLATPTLKTVPVGVPPSRLAGVGMFTTSGVIEIPVLPAPGTEYSLDTPAPLSEIQKGLPELSEMPHGVTRW